jgi:transposase
VARLLVGIPERLIQEFRQAPVKHAAETGWRTTGHNGYACLFSGFLLHRSSSAQP